jgi:tetratricopeptide (TPR) repeat protein
VAAVLRGVRRHPWRTAVVVLLLAAGAVAGVYYWDQYHLGAARQAIRLEQWDKARRHIDWVWPRREEVLLLAARLERLALNHKEAEARLNECKELRGDADAAIQLEWLLLRAEWGEIDKVAPGLWHSVNSGDPEAPAILEALTRGYVRGTRFLEAARCADRWVEIAPESAKAYYWRGRVVMVQENQEGAERDFLRALELEPEFAEARLKLAVVYVGQRNAPAALPHLEILQRAEPDSPAVLAYLAQCRLLMGQIEEARRLSDALFRVAPDDPYGLALRGALELQDSKPREAERWLRRAVKADPTNTTALSNLYLSIKSDPGRKQEAAKALAHWHRVRADMERVAQLLHERIQRRSDTGADLPAEVGSLYLRNGNERLGLPWLNLALARDPAHKGAHQALADFYERTGRPDLAAEHRAQAR